MIEVLFLALVTPGIALNYFDQNPIYSSFDCNEITEQIVEVSHKYFEDQFAVTLVDLFSTPTASSFKCSKGNTFRPVDVISEVEQIKIRSKFDRSSVSTFPLTEGFLLNTDLNLTRELLPLISSYNPRMNVLVILSSPTDEEVQDLIRRAYEDHKMLNFGVLTMKDFYNDGKYNKTTVNIILYNPFYGNQTKRDPQFLHLDFSEKPLEKLDLMKNFMKKRLTNLHGYPLEINIFDYPMISKAQYDANGKIERYRYVDGSFVQMLSSLMNFTPSYLNNSGNQGMFGYQQRNGTFVGSLGDIEYNRVSLAANPVLIANYNTSNLVFLQPITMSHLYFFVRKRATRKYFSISNFDRFDQPSIIITILLAFLLPTFHWIISRCEERIFDSRKRVSSAVRSFLDTFAILNNVSVKHPFYTGTRIVIASTMFYNLVTSTLFQSNIVKDLTANREDGKISTIDELTNEGYKIKMPAHFGLVFNGLGNDKVSLMLNKTKQTAVDVGVETFDLESIIQPKEKIAFLWMDLYMTNYLDRFFDNETGENLFEGVPEIAFKFYLANVVPKHSPFIERFNEIIIRYLELGIGDYHIGHAYSDNQIVMIRRLKNGQVPETQIRAMKLIDFRNMFKFFLHLIAVSVIVFLLEVLGRKIKIAFEKKFLIV